MLFFTGNNTRNAIISEMRKHKNIKYESKLKIEDSIEDIYKTVINDVIDIYKLYCADNLITSDSLTGIATDSDSAIREIQGSTLETHRKFSMGNPEITNNKEPNGIKAVETLDKIQEDFLDDQALLCFGKYEKTYAVLSTAMNMPKISRKEWQEPIDTCETDEAIAPLLAFIIGHGEFSSIDFSSIKTNVLKSHNNQIMKQLIEKRLNIIKKYFSITDFCDSMKLTKELESDIDSAITFAEENNIPKWIIFDMLIDLREISMITGAPITIKTSTQKRIMEIPVEYQNYPVLDRLVKDLYEEILK
jgi:hypothetical protein